MTSFSGTTPTDAVELQKLLASDFATGEYFGYSVALSSDGLTAIVGAYLEDTSPNSDNGAAYVFTRSAGVWTEQQKLLASDAVAGDQFGYSVDISGDGNTVLIGAPNEDTLFFDNGAAYIFTRSGTTWTQQQKLLASDRGTPDLFGNSVALSSNGSTAIVGAWLENTTVSDQGAAYVFTVSSGIWTEQAKLLASDPAASDYFGFSVALSASGSTALIGAIDEDSITVGNGAVYVFTRSGTTWTQQTKILLEIGIRATGDEFGHSVALSGDGNTALIGARFRNFAFVFTRSGSTWTQQQILAASDAAASTDYFGSSVSISTDGNTALIGAPIEDTSPNSNNGAAYIFTRTAGVWTEQQKLLASDRASGDGFGESVALSGDGSIAIIGSPEQSTSPNTINGAAYIYALGRTKDNKLYSYNSTLGAWDVSAFGELLAPATRVFTSSDTFVVPTGAKVIEVTCIGGGGGGGGGARNLSGDRGGGGGGGGGLSRYLFRAEDLGGVDASITVTVGTGGAGGAATASGTTALDGNNGVSGGTTSFGTFLYAYGGTNGLGGSATPQAGGAGGLGMFTGSLGGNASYPADNGAASGGGGGGGASFGLGSVPSAFNLTQSGTAGSAGTSNATLRGPGSGGNGRTSTTTTVLAAGAGGLYGGGGGGGGEGSTGGATGAGGAGGAGASGACFVTVWYG
jgi:hypothetical protein